MKIVALVLHFCILAAMVGATEPALGYSPPKDGDLLVGIVQAIVADPIEGIWLVVFTDEGNHVLVWFIFVDKVEIGYRICIYGTYRQVTMEYPTIGAVKVYIGHRYEVLYG